MTRITRDNADRSAFAVRSTRSTAQPAMAAIGVTDPASCVFVGDRPFDDIYGAARLGMRTVLIPHSNLPPHDGAVPDAVITRLADLPALLDQW